MYRRLCHYKEWRVVMGDSEGGGGPEKVGSSKTAFVCFCQFVAYIRTDTPYHFTPLRACAARGHKLTISHVCTPLYVPPCMYPCMYPHVRI